MELFKKNLSGYELNFNISRHGKIVLGHPYDLKFVAFENSAENDFSNSFHRSLFIVTFPWTYSVQISRHSERVSVGFIFGANLVWGGPYLRFISSFKMFCNFKQLLSNAACRYILPSNRRLYFLQSLPCYRNFLVRYWVGSVVEFVFYKGYYSPYLCSTQKPATLANVIKGGVS